MQGTILLNYDENTHRVEDEEKSRFLRGVIEQCFEDVPDVTGQIAEIWPENGSLPVEQKIKLRGILAKYKITVIDSSEGMKISLDNKIIGEWRKSFFNLRKDASVQDPKQRVYIEMHTDCWSIFDQQENKEPQ